MLEEIQMIIDFFMTPKKKKLIKTYLSYAFNIEGKTQYAQVKVKNWKDLNRYTESKVTVFLICAITIDQKRFALSNLTVNVCFYY